MHRNTYPELHKRPDANLQRETGQHGRFTEQCVKGACWNLSLCLRDKTRPFLHSSLSFLAEDFLVNGTRREPNNGMSSPACFAHSFRDFRG
ncbi:hypothetical protein Q7C36_012623 [Tachysurus vachellii]|uniref:Uncharacterized protein n=1 Tax=Tachysurus vachellii TaxID=175792 RepID=A0AA88MPR7_TACVA|nr:hypothetical protein Q7C36_012623 [Tachysurus vachellii]